MNVASALTLRGAVSTTAPEQHGSELERYIRIDRMAKRLAQRIHERYLFGRSSRMGQPPTNQRARVYRDFLLRRNKKLDGASEKW